MLNCNHFFWNETYAISRDHDKYIIGVMCLINNSVLIYTTWLYLSGRACIYTFDLLYFKLLVNETEICPNGMVSSNQMSLLALQSAFILLLVFLFPVPDNLTWREQIFLIAFNNSGGEDLLPRALGEGGEEEIRRELGEKRFGSQEIWLFALIPSTSVDLIFS